MNISHINSTNYGINPIKVDGYDKKSNNISYKSRDNIPDKSIAEVAGRSQVVSFKGDNKFIGNLFIHDCSEILGKKENIQYNREDGSFSHTIYNRDGSISRKEEYYPLQGKEVITTADLYGTTIKTQIPNSKVVEKLDNDGRQVFWEITYNNGDKKNVITQYKQGRRIIRETVNGIVTAPKIVDLRTGEYVTSGKLVYQRVYDKNTDMYVTENIITGQVIKEEKYGTNKKLQYLAEYNPATNILVFQKRLNNRTNGYDEYTYYPSGAKQTYTSISKNEREKEKYEYANDGRTIIAHSFTETDKSGQMFFERIYNPNNGRVCQETEINGTITNIYLFSDYPNRPYCCDAYDNGFRTEHIEFQNDGETYASMTKFNSDGTRQELLFNRFGKQTSSEFYSSDNYMFKRIEYNEEHGKPKRIIENNKYTGEQTKYIYDDLTGELSSKKVTYSDGKPKETTEYYPGRNEIPRVKKEYRRDGSYTATFYDTFSRETGKEEFNADNTRKGYRQQNNWNSSSSSNSYGFRTRYAGNNSQSSRKSKLSTKETLDKLLNILSKKNAWDLDKVSDDEWKILLDITGFKTTDELLDMDSDTYRHLTKKFHPDINANSPNKDECEVVFKIISNINAANKKKS